MFDPVLGQAVCIGVTVPAAVVPPT